MGNLKKGNVLTRMGGLHNIQGQPLKPFVEVALGDADVQKLAEKDRPPGVQWTTYSKA